MSFYEDNVDDGSHCGSCCQFMGQPVGFPRVCGECEGVQPVIVLQKASAGLTKSQNNARKRRAKARKAQEAGNHD